jgi:hypothetical protein
LQQCDIVRFSVWYSGSRAYKSIPYCPSCGSWMINVMIKSYSSYSYFTYWSREFVVAEFDMILWSLGMDEYWFEFNLPWNLSCFGHLNIIVIGKLCVSKIAWKWDKGWILKWRIALAGPHSPDAQAGRGCCITKIYMKIKKRKWIYESLPFVELIVYIIYDIYIHILI